MGAIFLKIDDKLTINLEHVAGIVSREDGSLTLYHVGSTLGTPVTEVRVKEKLLKFIEARSLLI